MNLIFPVVHQGRRADDQRGRVRLAVPLIQEERDNLNRLSKAHIIRQNSAKPVGIQGLKPPEARFLVFSQHGTERQRYLKITVFHGFHAADHSLKQRIAVKRDACALF